MNNTIYFVAFGDSTKSQSDQKKSQLVSPCGKAFQRDCF